MQTTAEWVRENSHGPVTADDEQLNAAGRRPGSSVYRHLEGARRIIIHHSATETGCARVFRSLHRAVNGWVDIGYHFVIGNGSLSRDGDVEEGRPAWAVGAHARHNNEDSIGVCLVGDMNLHPPTEEQLRSLGRLMATLMARHGLGPEDLYLHGDLPGCSTECPGSHLTLELVRGLLEGDGE